MKKRKREIITIDEEKCNGCGLCIPSCPEGALQMIDGKARLVSDLFCDGLGACIGHCPQEAITIEERDAAPYDERRVMENIVRQRKNVIQAHLIHLKEHNQHEYLKQAIEFLQENNIRLPQDFKEAEIRESVHSHMPTGCPGAKMVDFNKQQENAEEETPRVKLASQLRQWPIQLHLIMPTAPYYQSKDVLLVADCVAYALGSFHPDYLRRKSIAIACPKLDEGQDVYRDKIKSWFEDAKINTLTVMIMQVPCCSGLLHLAKQALESSTRKVPIKSVVVGLEGEILSEEWLEEEPLSLTKRRLP